MITAIETQQIYKRHDINLTQIESVEIAADANDSEKNGHKGLTAQQWVARWIQEELHENMDAPSFSERLEYDFSQN
jgi:hypothetical protein